MRKQKKDFDEYKHWENMNTNHSRSEETTYSTNNIQICREWIGIDGFWRFLSDMGTKPSDKHKLYRIDAFGNYCKDNCIWAMHDPKVQKKEQCTKRSPIEYKGKLYKTFSELCEAFNLDYKMSLKRKRAGWSLDDIINEPNQRENPTRRYLNNFFKMLFDK